MPEITDFPTILPRFQICRAILFVGQAPVRGAGSRSWGRLSVLGAKNTFFLPRFARSFFLVFPSAGLSQQPVEQFCSWGGLLILSCGDFVHVFYQCKLSPPVPAEKVIGEYVLKFQELDCSCREGSPVNKQFLNCFID